MWSRLLFASGLALFALLVASTGATVLAGGLPQPAPPASIHQHRTPSTAEQDHATGGPLIGRDQAVRTAMSVGIGPAALVSADLQTVGQATLALGFRAATSYVADDREVWVVKLTGPYKPAFWFGGPAPIYDHYWVVIDATTGKVIGTGSQPTSGERSTARSSVVHANASA